MPSGARGGNTAGQHSFAMVPRAEIQRSVFDRSCGLKTTFASSYLYPIFCDEALPGDTMSMRASIFGRMATLIHPIIENVYMDFFFFAVPNRLVWDNWHKFNGEQKNPGDSTSFVIPTMTAPGGGYASMSLSDFMGLPIGKVFTHSALWHRAYNLIWNEWFRDQNLQNSVVVDTGDAASDPADYVLLKRGKRHDYFTGCLPWPQKGTAVVLPLGLTAPVERIPGTPPTFVGMGANAVAGDKNIQGTHTSTATTWDATPFSAGGVQDMEWGTQTGLRTNLATATAATINQIREAFQMQRLFERDARGGTRYTEIIRSHFGVVSDDARLQRPEYLGGGSVRININAVANTANTATGASGTATLKANGTFAGDSIGFQKSFTEHCVLLGLVNVRADLNYQQGVERMWSRSTRFDFYWPALAHLGEQAVLNKEIFVQGTAADTNVFGYQERYAEYRYKPSICTGKMRSDASDPLDSWHLAQDFAALPALNASFIEDAPPMSRVLAFSESLEPQFLLDAFFQYKCTRPMPVFGVPGLIDHF